MTIGSGNRRVYSFKSVGVNQEEFDADNPNTTLGEPIGFMTPLRLGDRNGGVFAMHRLMSDQVSDNLRNLIMTNHGERLGLYDFGGNLRTLVAELGTEGGDSAAIRYISKAVEKYMPFVDLETFESFKEPGPRGLAKIGVRVVYNVPQLNVSGKGLEILLYMMG